MGKNAYRLSDFFSSPDLVRDGAFTHLDEAEARETGALVFCQNLAFLELANANPNVTAIITTPELAPEARAPAVATSADPRLAFFRIYGGLAADDAAPEPAGPGVGEACQIHPGAAISNRARIGSGVTIAANAVIESDVEIGDGCYIGANAVIGAEGMMTVWQPDGTPLIVRHAGGVSIGRGAVILAGAVVAKSLYRRYTRIGDYCQIGIMANIGHGVSLGDRCVISGNCVVAGRTVLEDGVWMGVSASVAPGLRIGAGAQIKMGSVVVGDVAAGQVVSGNFALPHKVNMKHHLGLARP